MHLHDRGGTLTSLLHKAEKLSVSLFVCPSVCTFRHTDNSVPSVSIEIGLARNESCVIDDHRVYFLKSTEEVAHQHERAKGTCVTKKPLS